MPICIVSRAISEMPAIGTGRPVAKDALETEWERIAAALLADKEK